MPVLRNDINADTDLIRAAAAYTPVDASAVIDLDFARQRYWWGGSLHPTTDFAAFSLSGSTFDATGLTCSGTQDIRVSLTGLGTFAPGALAIAAINSSAPGGTRAWAGLDNGGTTERAYIVQTATAAMAANIIATNTLQASPSGGTTTTIGVKHGFATSFDLNNVLGSGNGVAGVQDTVALLNSGLTTLRIGKFSTATSHALGAIARVLVFATTKTQAQLDTLSAAMRDNS